MRSALFFGLVTAATLALASLCGCQSCVGGSSEDQGAPSSAAPTDRPVGAIPRTRPHMLGPGLRLRNLLPGDAATDAGSSDD